MQRGTAVRHARWAADAFLIAAFAPVCAACDVPLREPSRGCVCSRCWNGILPPPPPDRTPHISILSAGGRYDGPLRHIIHAFKYDGRRSLAVPLAMRMRARGADALRDAACLVPVPLHPWRRLHRGFNQAADLARALDLPVVHALWRRHWTGSQAGLTKDARHHNVREAFAPSPLRLASRTAETIRGRAVVLVDDVRTTGATLDACARVLREMGAADVRAVTAAVRVGGED